MNFRERILNYNPDVDAASIDFETYYSDTYSVKGSSYWAYCHHEEFDPYMVSIYSTKRDVSFVGHPKDFDWSLIEDCIWVSHNSPFDRAVYESIVNHLKWVPAVRYHAWVNTADLARFLQVPGNLAGAVKDLLGRIRSKKIRSDMKGKKYLDIPDEEKESWKQYALDDAVDCLELWETFSPKWPVQEQLASLQTSEMISRGVYVNREKLDQYTSVIKKAVDLAETSIPWFGEPVKLKNGKFKMSKGRVVLKKPASAIELAKYCRDNNVPVPPSTDVKDEAFQEWESKYGEEFPVVRAIQTWRKCNRLLRLFEEITNRIRADGRMEFPLCYFGGGNTGRWSGRPGEVGDSGVNMQNMVKAKFFFDKDGFFIGTSDELKKDDPRIALEMDYRSLFCPAPGKKMVVIDLSQIEPRVLNWLVDNYAFLEMCKKTSPYQAHAELTMGWDSIKGDLKKLNPRMYALAKARILALGFGAGFKKFLGMALMYVGQETFDVIFKARPSDEDLMRFESYLKFLAEKMKAKEYYEEYVTLDEVTKWSWVNSWLQVSDFRETNPLITGFWKEMQDLLTDAITNRKPALTLNLPSWRSIRYHSFSRTDFSGEVVPGRRKRLYGGMIVENLTQATARDVFVECSLNLERHGLPVLWPVHDEAIVEIDEHQTVEDVYEHFLRPIPWAEGVPLAAEGHEVPHYCK